TVLDDFRAPAIALDPNASAGNGKLPVKQPASTDVESQPADGISWHKIQRKLGPAYFERVGVLFADGKIKFLLDASLRISPLSITLEGLSVESPLDKFDPHFGLRGIGLEFKGGPVEIGGTFLDLGDGEY